MPKPIHLHNTLTRTTELLSPKNPNQVTIYTCGLTVYSAPHIGNFRSFIFEDVLVKTLRHLGYGVKRVMNVTDVGHLTSDEDAGEDKMQVGAMREGVTAWDIAKKYEAQFLSELEELHIEKPDLLIRATDTIEDQISLIKTLEEKGFTYMASDGLYFDSSKVADYGKLARLDLEGLKAGARVELQKDKKSISDFALWRLSPPGEKRDMEWQSPWGTGFPGWHIECSAIAMKYLGDQIDIHCGGVDHIPVHHTNEIAQSETATGKKFVSVWLHNEFLQVDGGKMGKSLQNAYSLDDLKKRGFTPLAFRLFSYSAVYRAKLNFTWEAMESAQISWNRLSGLVLGLGEESGMIPVEWQERFDQSLGNDLNTAEALAVVWELLRADVANSSKRAFMEMAEKVLSLGLLEKEYVEVPESVKLLVEAREQARNQANWQESDLLRTKINELGFEVKDVPGGLTEITKRVIVHRSEGNE